MEIAFLVELKVVSLQCELPGTSHAGLWFMPYYALTEGPSENGEVLSARCKARQAPKLSSFAVVITSLQQPSCEGGRAEAIRFP